MGELDQLHKAFALSALAEVGNICFWRIIPINSKFKNRCKIVVVSDGTFVIRDLVSIPPDFYLTIGSVRPLNLENKIIPDIQGKLFCRENFFGRYGLGFTNYSLSTISNCRKKSALSISESQRGAAGALTKLCLCLARH